MRNRRRLELILAGVIVGVAITLPPAGQARLHVASDSMEPTAFAGDWVETESVSTVRLQRGDLVTFRSPDGGDLLLKRAVALGGDELAIEDDGVLIVNGVAVVEPYVDPEDVDALYFGPIRVPSGHVFVLGDNRDESIDSLAFGAVPAAAIEGVVVRVDTAPGEQTDGR